MSHLDLPAALFTCSLVLMVASCGQPSGSPALEASGLEGDAAFVEVLEQFGSNFEASTWLQETAPLTREGLESGMAVLPEAERKTLLAGLVDARILTVLEREQSNHMVIVTLMSWDSDASASAYVAAERVAMGDKDDLPGVETASYRTVEASDLEGFISEKGLRDFFGAYPVLSLVAARGRLIVEVTYMADEADDARLLEVARAFFDALGIEAP